MTRLRFDSYRSRRGPATGEFVCGAAVADITPAQNVAMAGYSFDGFIGRPDASDPLCARAVYFRDGDGRQVAFCFVDLWCGSNYLLKSAARRLRDLGIGEDGLVIAGTHVHTGPGRFMGNALYDIFAQCRPGFAPRVADGLVAGIERAVRQAVAQARPAKVAVAATKIWGLSRNRSYPAFLENFGSEGIAAWLVDGMPGHGAPAGLDDMAKAIDPRLTVVSAFEEAVPSKLIASFATFSCHATALGNFEYPFRRDWPAHAIGHVESCLRDSHPDAVFALGNSAAGDATPLPIPQGPPQDPPEPVPHGQGEDLAKRVGEGVGAKWAALAAASAASAARPTVDARLSWWEPLAGGGSSGAPIVDWTMGAPLLGGAEDYRTGSYGYGLFKVYEGMTDDFFPPSDPRNPMEPAFGHLQFFIRAIFERIAPADRHPLHCIRIGDHVFATVPGEPTSVTANTLERRIAAAHAASGHPASGVTILGYSGDYSGYFATEKEYGLQHYEGANTLYGRKSVDVMASQYEALVTGSVARRRAGLRELRTMTRNEATQLWTDTLLAASRRQPVRVTQPAPGRVVVTFVARGDEVPTAAEAAARVEIVRATPPSRGDERGVKLEAVDATLFRGLPRRAPRLWVVTVPMPAEKESASHGLRVRVRVGGRSVQVPVPAPGGAERPAPGARKQPRA